MSRELLLQAHLKRLKLPTVRRLYKELAREAADHNKSYEDYLLALLEQEVVQRDESQLRQRLKRAAFPVLKTLDTFDFSVIPSLNKQKVLTLSQAEFVANRESVLFIGNSGTGKSHLATALGVCACRKGYRVRFWKAGELVQELLEAQHEHRLSRFEKQWLRLDLVILDELGFLSMSRTEAELLFQFCAAKYERGSVMITSNLEFSEWPQVLGDEKMTAALLDRLTHRAHIIPVNGESYRFRESMRRQQEAGEHATLPLPAGQN